MMALLHPILMRTVWDPSVYDPITGYDFEILRHPAPPSWRHLLGTDPLGRDVLSQLMYSTQTEFILGVVAALITVSIGTMIGAVSAYYGGIIDTLFMRLADLVIMLPFISILIVLSALFKLNMLKLALVIGILSGFGGVTVIIKSQALTIKVKPYIEAARVAGGGDWHIIFVHFVPNLLPLSFLYMMFTVTSAIFSEAVLSFFGLINIRMSWGIMIHTTQTAGYLLNVGQYWWLVIPAGLAITLLCSAFYLVGRALDEVVNPRLRRR
ncbi:MAG: ABC transporter permease [Chloroflexi bacterium]|nr:ABC transporter permease [Chloroflexota bacterium]